MTLAALGFTPGCDDPIRRTLAQRNIELAQHGERDPERLCEGGLAGLSVLLSTGDGPRKEKPRGSGSVRPNRVFAPRAYNNSVLWRTLLPAAPQTFQASPTDFSRLRWTSARNRYFLATAVRRS